MSEFYGKPDGEAIAKIIALSITILSILAFNTIDRNRSQIYLKGEQPTDNQAS